MAKKKNHTNHNQNRKNHRNGIKKVKRTNKPDFTGVDRFVLKNNQYAALYQQKGKRMPGEDHTL